MRTVVALYDMRETVRDVIQDLVDSGFSRDEISIATRGEEGKEMHIEETRDREAGTEAGEGAAIGGGVGAILGGIGGLLVGLGTLVIPGIGAVIAAGPLVGLLGGALAGGIAGGLVGGLIGLGIPEEDARIYAEGVRRGGTLVIVRTSDASADEARSIMERHNPINIERSEKRWRQMGWEGYDKEATVLTDSDLERERRAFADERYGYAMGTEERMVQGMEPGERRVAGDGGRRETRGRFEEQTEKLWHNHEQEFEEHYRHVYADTGHDFGYFQPAYRYGCQLAAHDQFGTRDWNEIENEARRRWIDVNDDESWKIVRDAVRESFDRCELDRM